MKILFTWKLWANGRRHSSRLLQRILQIKIEYNNVRKCRPLTETMCHFTRRSDQRIWTGGGLWLPCSIQESGYWPEGIYPTDRVLLLYYNPQLRSHLLIIGLHCLVAVLFLLTALLPHLTAPIHCRRSTQYWHIFWQMVEATSSHYYH